MLQYLNTLLDLKRDKKGVTALEYGLIAALIAVVIIGSVTTLGGRLNTTFTNIGGHFGTGAVNGLATAPAAGK